MAQDPNVFTELVIGAGDLLIGTNAATALDAADIPDLAAGTYPSGWSLLSETTKPISVKDEPKYVEARSDQRARVIDAAVDEVNTTIETAIRQLPIDRIADVFRATPVVDGDTTTVVATGKGAVPKFKCAVLSPAPGTGTYTLIYAPRCRQFGSREIAYTSKEYTELAVQIEVLEAESGDAVTIYEGTSSES